jgi:hypothetical protein
MTSRLRDRLPCQLVQTDKFSQFFYGHHAIHCTLLGAYRQEYQHGGRANLWDGNNITRSATSCKVLEICVAIGHWGLKMYGGARNLHLYFGFMP